MATKSIIRTAKKPAAKPVKKTVKTVKTVKSSKAVSKARVEPSLTVPVLDVDGKKTGTVTLPKEIFDVTVSPKLIAQATRVYSANQRQSSAKTKTRGEVTGSRRKVWRQKGTGRARHGDRYAPIFVGGGIAHGPRPRDFSRDLPKRMRRKALSAVLTNFLQEGKIVVIDGLDSLKPKTLTLMGTLAKIGCPVRHKKLTHSVLIATPAKSESVVRSGRNIQSLSVREVKLLTLTELLKQSQLVLMKDAVDIMGATVKR